MLRNCYRLALALTLLSSAGLAEQRVVTDYRDYAIRLSSWRSSGGQQAGVLVPVRINNGRMLRLLLDSGASGFTVGNRVARELGLQPQAETLLVGLGEGRAEQTPVAVAKSVQIGDLGLADCRVQIFS